MEKPTKRIWFVVTTPKTRAEYILSEEYEILGKIFTIDQQTSIKIVSENKDGLPSVYNRFMVERYRGDIVRFIHDDLLLYDIYVREKLLEAHKKYPIVGLAGTTKITRPIRMIEPTTWNNLGQSGMKRNWSGFVAHQKDGKCWSTNFGSTPQRCVLLDGLFMSFDVGVCLDAGFEFDEDFEFHHYDLSACMRANALGLKMTTCPIHVSHKGMGTLDDRWKASHRLFVEKYASGYK